MPLSRRKFSALVAASPLVGMLPSAVATAQDAPVLRVAMNTSDIGTLDPHFASGTQDRAIVDMIFNGLIRFKPGDSTSFEPDIATDMPESTDNDDGTQTWTFTLRDDAMTQPTEGVDSYALTADDVVFSFKKAASEDTSAYAGNYTGWEFAKGTEKNTFTITVPEPISDSLLYPNVANYSGGYIIPQKVYEKIGADGFITNPVGTGPFAFESHTPQQNVMLTAFGDYFRGAPKLGGVTVNFLADPNAREVGLQSGELDVISGLPEAQWSDRMNETDGIKSDVFGVGEAVFINLDVEHEVLKDAKVREAIMLAVDRNNHIGLSGEPVAKAIFSVVPADLMPGGLTEDQANEAGVNEEPNIDKAKELMAEAGYSNGFELELVASEQTAYRSNYEVLQEELRQIGIEIKLEVVQHDAMHSLIREGRNPIVIYIAYRPTADVYLSQFFTTGKETNFSHYSVDAQVDKARAETDGDAQAEIWRQANIDIEKNFAAKGLMYVNQVYARSEKVDYGHELKSVAQLYPGIDETTTINS